MFPPPSQRDWRYYLFVSIASIAAIAAILFIFTYFRYARLIDRKLAEGPFSATADIYAANPPLLVMNLSDRNREDRRLARYDEIPKVLIDAVLAVEDKRFFQHNGFDYPRILKAAWVDLKEGRKGQGASTLSMQLARNLWLASEKSWSRKLAEMAMAMRLEEKLTKEQILEYYFNQVYLGRRGVYSLHGFGAAADAYFGKDLRELTLAESATLAGLIQRPNYYAPSRNLDRARRRRNGVLSLMRKNGAITETEYLEASQTPLAVAAPKLHAGTAPYFIDLVSEELLDRIGEKESDQPHKALRVYTTLDLELQEAAGEAVRTGMRQLDDLIRRRAGKKPVPSPPPQVALVALDPRTGDVKALVGGRDYNATQLNRAIAMRQPGSVFKPFVYAAALNTGLIRGDTVITPATVIDDEPTAFSAVEGDYTPGNFGGAFYGPVTVRTALVKSINVPTVKLAQMAGYRAVAQLARDAGLGEHVRPTPSVALGAYDARPLDVAGAYTIYVNSGDYISPGLISRIQDGDGQVIYQRNPERRRVLDPRVAYLTLNLMESVMNRGTAAGARSRGFYLPAAGKTGTSRDGWFAGFTSELIAVVWVGYDDNRDLNLEGGKSALPIWTEFMKRAAKLPAYSKAKPFRPPRGITSADIDPESGELASGACPENQMEFFIAGTEPTQQCHLHGGIRPLTVFRKIWPF